MRNSQVLGLGDVAVLTGDRGVQIPLNRESETSTGVAGLLVNLVLRSREMAELADNGVKLDVEFVETMLAALCGGGSALLFFLHSDGLGDARELLGALAPFRGAIHQTTLSPGSEELLRGIQ